MNWGQVARLFWGFLVGWGLVTWMDRPPVHVALYTLAIGPVWALVMDRLLTAIDAWMRKMWGNVYVGECLNGEDSEGRR